MNMRRGAVASISPRSCFENGLGLFLQRAAVAPRALLEPLDDGAIDVAHQNLGHNDVHPRVRVLTKC